MGVLAGILRAIGVGVGSGVSFAGFLAAIRSLVFTFLVTTFGWELVKTGGVQKAAGAAGDVIAGGGKVAGAAGNLAEKTSSISTDALLLLGGAALVLFLVKR